MLIVPQIIRNFRKKCTQGLSYLLVGFNLFGDIFKLVYFIIKVSSYILFRYKHFSLFFAESFKCVSTRSSFSKYFSTERINLFSKKIIINLWYKIINIILMMLSKQTLRRISMILKWWKMQFKNNLLLMIQIKIMDQKDHLI